MAQNVTPDDLRLAAEWCIENEGDPEESGPIHRVAEWLRRRADLLDEDREIREIERQANCNRAMAREVLRRVKEARLVSKPSV